MNKYTQIPEEEDHAAGMDLYIPEHRYAKILFTATSDEGLHSIIYIDGEYLMLTKIKEVFHWNPVPAPEELMSLAKSCAEHYI